MVRGFGRHRSRQGDDCPYSIGAEELIQSKGRGGVLEYKIDFGPGYRIYFGKDGERLVILISGGTKKRQDEDIAEAQRCWIDYKRRKKNAPYP